MSHAPDYDPTTGFATDETNQVAGRSVQKSVSLDTEFANISSSINGLNANIQEIQRADGKLKDASIEPYALSEQTLALITVGGNPRGVWAASTDYEFKDVVEYNSVAYICLTEHNSGSMFATSLWLGISGDGSSSLNAAAAAASETAAAASETAAATSETNAGNSETAAAASAATAATSVTDAENQATAAAASATAAAGSAATAGSLISSAIPKADTASAEAGTADDEYMTPLKTKQFVDANVNTIKSIDQMVGTGYNGCLIRSGGKVYLLAGNQNSYYTYVNGVAPVANYLSRYSTAAPTRIDVNNQTIVDVGAMDLGNAYALTDNGDLYTWGLNDNGQCGHNSTAYIGEPTLVDSNVDEVYTSVSNQGYSSDGRLVYKKSDGFLYGCGYNVNGALGLGNTTNQLTPVQLTAFGANPISVWNLGTVYGCLIVEDSAGEILYAGNNGYGQSGNGSTATPISTPTNVTVAWKGVGNESHRILKASGGSGYFSTAAQNTATVHMLIDDGGDRIIMSSGYGLGGAIGNGASANVSTPIEANVGTGLIEEISVLGGISTVYALKADGNLYAWGRNTEGQAGAGATAVINTPTIVKSGVEKLLLKDWNMHTYGYRGAMFIELTNGEVHSTGYNVSAGLCNGDITSINVFAKSQLSAFTEYGGDPIEHFGFYETTTGNGGFVCATESGRFAAWGYNGQSFVTDTGTANVATPHEFLL